MNGPPSMLNGPPRPAFGPPPGALPSQNIARPPGPQLISNPPNMSGPPNQRGPVPPGPPGGMMGGPPRPGPQPIAPPSSLGPPNGAPGPPNLAARPRIPISQNSSGNFSVSQINGPPRPVGPPSGALPPQNIARTGPQPMAFRSGGPPKMGPVPPPSGPPGGMMGGPPRPGPQPMAPPPSLGPPNGTPGPPNFAQPRPPTSQSGGGLAPPPMSVPPVSAPPTSFGGNNVPPLGPPPTSFGGPNSAPPPPPSSTSFGGSYQQPPTRPPLTNGSQNPKYPAYPTSTPSNNVLPTPPPPSVSGGDNFYQNQGVPGNFQPPITRPPLTNGSQNPKYPAYPSNNNTGQQQPPPPPVSGGYPQQPPVSGGDNFYQNQGSSSVQNLASRLGNFSLNQGMEPVDLLQNRHILPSKVIEPPKVKLQTELWNSMNCSPDIFRSTLTKIPETESILKKCRLPLGILIHPFKDLSHLPVIQCATIVRCRQCRTYINPFVHFVDQRRWRCNVCYRVNELPEEFLYDPVSKSYGDPSRRPECKSATIEFIAPTEYMLRPPQPAVYVFCLDVSHGAVATGYLKVFCDTLLDELEKLPGDSRTQIGFITYDRVVHFYSMPEGATQPTQLTVCDVMDMFLPSPSDLLVNLNEARSLVHQLLEELPNMFKDTNETFSAVGAAMQAAYKMVSPTGGRVTVFQHTLPTIGPGAVTPREVQGSEKKVDSSLLGPATDFYKKLALDCSGQQVAVDLWTFGSSYVDLATLSGISKFSGGQVQHFPGYHVVHNTPMAAKFESALRRYFTRKIGFEAVMRIRCTRGLALHTFHGNFFVRSTDLLSLPNINPDAGFGMQVSIEDDLRDSREVTFQAALLYTSSKGERRIRVHTLCLPTSASVNDIINGADQQAVVGMLAKFAADRSVTDSVADAKEGLVVSCVDTIETYRQQASMSIPSGLLISQSLRLLPLFVLACLRSSGFRNNVRVDERSYCFSQFKTLPLTLLLQLVYPDLYRIDTLTDEGAIKEEDDNGAEIIIPQPTRLQLSFEKISATGMYLLDVGDIIYIYICRGIHALILERLLGITRLQDVDETLTELPERDNEESERLRVFISWLNASKPYPAPIQLIREDSKARTIFVQHMIEDRLDGSFSYFEFLQHLKQQSK